ncbi:unnamed protein product [Ectocarpus fasciculatus]
MCLVSSKAPNTGMGVFVANGQAKEFGEMHPSLARGVHICVRFTSVACDCCCSFLLCLIFLVVFTISCDLALKSNRPRLFEYVLLMLLFSGLFFLPCLGR